MKIYKLIITLLLLNGVFAYSQDSIQLKPLSQYPQDQLKTDEYGKKYYYDHLQKARIYDINGESVVVIDELVMLNKPKFNNQLDRNYYFFINKKLARVYPLFLTALDQYRDIQTEMSNLNPNQQRKYTRERQAKLADQYEAQLRDLTTTEGRVFAKLMSRATDKTVYEIIKELRGGWSAFWWNVKGNIADVDIKTPYNPHADRTDLFIESLLQSNWSLGYLKPYPGAMQYRIQSRP